MIWDIALQPNIYAGFRAFIKYLKAAVFFRYALNDGCSLKKRKDLSCLTAKQINEANQWGQTPLIWDIALQPNIYAGFRAFIKYLKAAGFFRYALNDGCSLKKRKGFIMLNHQAF